MSVPEFTTQVSAFLPVFTCDKAHHNSKAEYKHPNWSAITTVGNSQRLRTHKDDQGVMAKLNEVGAVVDVDSKNGANVAEVRDLLDLLGIRAYAEVETPSGGAHFYVAGHADLASVAARDGVVGLTGLPGVEILSHGRAVYLPGTKRPKYNGGGYTVVHSDLTALARRGPEEQANGQRLLAWVEAARVRPVEVRTPDSPWDGEPLSEAQERYLLGALAGSRKRVAMCGEGERNNTIHTNAIGLGALVAGAGLDYDEAFAALLEGAEECGYIADEGERAAAATIRSGLAYGMQFPKAVTKNAVPLDVDVTFGSHSFEWLLDEVGRGRLSGLFRRGGEMVFVPRIGEDGYQPPKADSDDDGPAQVRRMNKYGLRTRVQVEYDLHRWENGKQVPAMFPDGLTELALHAEAMDTPHLRRLVGVAHTPVMRPDGTILWEPGHDKETGLLYLPDPGLVVPEVPDHPTREDLKSAGDLLLEMLAGFPFVTTHDRANYLGALMTPILRALVPPPYQLVAIGAPQPGSGKSLLAWIMREVHGGVFRSEFPRSDEELRKSITTILDRTSSPVVQFDNVRGTLASAVLDGLLTSSAWSDRKLGVLEHLDLVNDRLWVVTGNNLHIGGDLRRRVLPVTIDYGSPDPEKRSDFAIKDLKGWVREGRGDVLCALLTLVRGWVVAGRPVGELRTSDDYGKWVQVLGGILTHAGIDGTVGHQDTKVLGVEEDDEWAVFLAAVHRVFGDKPWTVAEVIAAETFADEITGEQIREEEIPVDRDGRDGKARNKALGKWLGYRIGRWAGGLSVEQVQKSGKTAAVWRVVGVPEED